MIVIFGAPGSGKTTQVQMLAKRLSCVRCEIEPTDGVKSLIGEVYAKKPGAAFRLQMHVLEKRRETYKRLRDERDDVLLIVDGHILTDYQMFVEPHFDSGAFDDEEKVVYLKHFEQALLEFQEAWQTIEKVVYLDASCVVAADRVSLRSSSAEAGVDPTVFEEFARSARRVVATFPDPSVIRVNADLDAESVNEKILAALKGVVDERHFVSSDESPAAEPAATAE